MVNQKTIFDFLPKKLEVEENKEKTSECWACGGFYIDPIFGFPCIECRSILAETEE